MKQKDIALIIVVVFISAVVSLVLARFVFSSPSQREQQVEIVPAITADFPTPDKKYFNKDSIDPTQLIQIGDGTNTNPFSGAAQ